MCSKSIMEKYLKCHFIRGNFVAGAWSIAAGVQKRRIYEHYAPEGEFYVDMNVSRS